ncbi:MAG: PEP-CTERM sorting domain-containing protein [Planctomycetes bacterium]|nr:PEP-CTERM sorting domain-containing protein [Planctomycetota bacterium]
MRFRHLLPLSALAAWVGAAAPALADPVSATANFKFRVGTTAPTASYWSAGHGDIDIHEETPGDWEIHYHFHEEEGEDPPSGGGSPAFPGTKGADGWEWEADALTTFITSTATAVTRPATGDAKYTGSQWNFLGVNPGSTFYVLPASETAGLPFLGFSAEGKPFDITFSLGAVTGGAISAWTEDAFGVPTPHWSSSTPGANGGFTVNAGGHAHMFIGFSALGDYTAQITAVPEPGSLGLAGAAGLGLAAFAWTRRRRG